MITAAQILEINELVCRLHVERDAALERERVLKQQFDDYIFAQRFADQDAQDGLKERDAAQERERVLIAEVAKIQDLIRLRLVNDELFLYDHPAEETIFIREWTDDAHQALTPEPSPESENHDN